jgi:iron-sulfur cluster protein
MARPARRGGRGLAVRQPGRRHQRDIGGEIGEALADPILREAMSRAMDTMHHRRAVAWPSEARFEELREQAERIKDEALERHGELLDLFESKAAAAGATVVRAEDAEAACAYVCALARERSVDLVVKSKSMTSEEIHLTPELEKLGVAVVEGDLGERIIQLAGERPSHLVVPAIHKNRVEIIRLFVEKMGIADPPTDAEGLTRLVRNDLRERFLHAGMGITGANFAIAETGSIVLVENEGNASLTTLLPPVHVAVVGREKLIPRLADLAVFLELLPRNATGQKMTSYVSVITGRQSSPLVGHTRGGYSGGTEREFHLVILDNGRTQALADGGLRETLRCIRCGACLNCCAPYSLVGGHVFGADPYPGGIGCAWTYITKGHAQAWDFNGLCTTCSRCTEVCPVKIDIPWLNTVVRERNNKEFGPGLRQRVFARTDLMGKSLSALAPLGNVAMGTPPARLCLSRLGVDPSRTMPAYERETFRDWWDHGAAGRHAGQPGLGPVPEPARVDVSTSGAAPATLPAEPAHKQSDPTGRAAIFVDCFVNHNLPQVGRAAVEVLERAGIEVIIAHNSCCGRAALSQGLLKKPRQWADENLSELGRLIGQGYDVVFIEPSCLSAVRDDYAPLKGSTGEDDERLRRVQERSYDITEYLVLLSRVGRLNLPLEPLPGTYLVHGHCHQKSLGIGSYPAELLRLVPGVSVHEVDVLCCGMVGSFGYKKEYSSLSMAIGTRLFEQIEQYAGDVVACGISCRSQIEMGTGRRVVHPVEVLAKASTTFIAGIHR